MKDGEVFGTTSAGEEVRRFAIRGGGLSANVIGWGAVIQDLRLAGHDAPLVLGYDRFEPYEADAAYFGAGVYGADAASQRYFGKPAKDLTLSEAAMLAGLVRAPSQLAPHRNLDGARGRAAR